MAQNKEDIDFLTKYLNDTVNNEDAALQGQEILLPNGSTKIFLFVNSCDACTSVKQPLQQSSKTKKDEEGAQKKPIFLIGQNR
jgi:hypothetical protein